MIKDFKINPMLWGGSANIDLSKCHGEIDLIPTPWGDVATTGTDAERNLQHILMWLATPLGERLDPKLGCIFFDYLFEKLIPANMGALERDLWTNLEYNFPEFHVLGTSCQFFWDDQTPTVYVVISLSNQDYKLLFTEDALLDHYRRVKSYLEAYGIKDLMSISTPYA